MFPAQMYYSNKKGVRSMRETKVYCDKCYSEIEENAKHVLTIGDKTYEFCSDTCLSLYLREFQRDLLAELAQALESERQNNLCKHMEFAVKIKELEERIKRLESNNIVPLVINPNDLPSYVTYPGTADKDWQSPVVTYDGIERIVSTNM